MPIKSQMLKHLPKLMPKSAREFAVAAVVAAVALAAPVMAQPPERVKAGTLACDISAGIGLIVTSKKSVACMFMPAQPGPREVYTGLIGKFGLNLDATAGGEMIWAVYAPSKKSFGALAGHYSGANVKATVGDVLGANALAGGLDRSVALQPLSLKDPADFNVATGVTEFDLRPAR